jgi:NAD(P)-dependent dehydrogenase (short-subunit alcohol dehydrogenase family)
MPMKNDYVPPRNLLAGRTILVTGAGDGIGRSASIAFAAHGARVLLLGRTVAKLESVYDEIAEAGGAEPGIIPLDLEGATQDNYDEVAAVVEDRYGSLEGLLHNAALLGERVPIANYTPTSWTRVMQVNLNAVFMLTRALLPAMHCAADASMLLTTSGVGAKPRAYWGAYAVSKHALEGLAIVLADELGTTSSIRTNLINPGATRTSMRAAAFPAEDPGTLKSPEDLLRVYLYLIGPDSAGVNGERFSA